MGLNIKDETLVATARKLAEETGDTMTGVIRKALERMRAEHDKAKSDYWAPIIEKRKRRSAEVLARMPKPRPGATSDHSDLYNEWGEPE